MGGAGDSFGSQLLGPFLKSSHAIALGSCLNQQIGIMRRRLFHFFTLGLLVVSALLGGAKLSAQDQGPITAEMVRRAIDRGVKYLKDQQDPRSGTWNDMADYPKGVTALCTLALLNSGVEPSDPSIQKALTTLRKVKPTKTYSVSLRTMAMCAAEPKRDLPIIQRYVRWLESTQLPNGLWSYPSGGGDNSNTQFAILALHEAERVGAKVDPATWRRAADYWAGCQNADGSWGYQANWKEGLGSMTCAGIGATVICSGRVNPANSEVKNGMINCCLPQEENDSLERALGWLGRNFSVRRNPGRRGMGHIWHYYYLYGLERVGRLTARRFIGGHDWYREGAEFLVRQQDPFNHSWVGSGHSEDMPHVVTSYALLFLSKGRRPVLIAKLKHNPGEDWNNHKSDVAHLTARAEQLWDLDMTWQIIELDEASVEDLLQAPVLFLSGSKTPSLKGEEKKIRDYLDRGGFLFAEACCVDGTRFEKELRSFVNRVFPEKEYDLRLAGPAHPLWRVEEFVRPESPYAGRIWTVEYGCRTCMVFSEIDLSCYWELFGTGRDQGLPEMTQNRLNDAMSVGVNVLAYATNREPKGKEAAFVDLTDMASLEAAESRGTIQIAKLQHGGGCNDAPGALVNLLRAAAQGELRLQISTTEFPLRADDKNLNRFIMAFMHGRHEFRFTQTERKALRTYLENGGTLLADAICASSEFTNAFRREMQAVLPDRKFQRVLVTDPLLTDLSGGFDIREVERRDPVVQQGDQPLRPRVRKVEPELEGIKIDGRWAVIFSPYDISCALEQHEAMECRGYTRKDAARIGLNVLMYTLTPDVGEGF